MPGERRDDRVHLITRCLEKVRARDGLTADHLRRHQGSGLDRLYDLPDVQERVERYPDAGREAAVVEVVRRCVLRDLDGTHRLIADGVLSLHALEHEFVGAGARPQTMKSLYSEAVGTRRETLLRHWTWFHRILGSEAPLSPPSDRTLRGKIEPASLDLLARALCGVRRTEPAAGVGPGIRRPGAGEPGDRPRVLVLGGAVTDVIFRTSRMPQPETSSEARGFEMDPGGKGLTQAVAAARLGIGPAMLAAVGDDYYGQEATAFLHEEGVDVSAVKRVADARTPFTAVVGYNVGESIAINWRNERDVHLDRRDVDAVLDADGPPYDVILLTFEVPHDIVEHALDRIQRWGPARPVTVVTPAPPYAEQTVGGHALAAIDYLVAYKWELNELFEAGRHLDLEALASQILSHGVGTLCVPVEAGCAVFSRHEPSFVAPSPPTLYRTTAAARDAFAAALAVRLAEGNPFSADVARWAAAAMSAATAVAGAPRSMPTRAQVNALATLAADSAAARVRAVVTR